MEKAIEYTLSAKRTSFQAKQIRVAEDAANFARKFYHDDISIYESSFIILLNAANIAVGYAKISQGGICATMVDERIVAKYALDAMASAVIFVHNHPSGNLRPSTADKNLSKSLEQILNVCRVKLLDSIIIAPEETFYSMRDNGDF